MTPKVSVLVTTHRHELRFRAALESVLCQQTAFAFEIVIVGDASSEETPSVAHEFAARYPEQVRVVQDLLQGFEACRGEYVATLDGDSYWPETGKLQRQADFLDAWPERAMCFHNCDIEYDEARFKPRRLVHWPLHEAVTSEDLLRGPIVEMSTIMMRRQVADAIRQRPQLLLVLPAWSIALLASQAGPVGYIDEMMSVSRQRVGGARSPSDRADRHTKVVLFYDEMRLLLGPAHDEIIGPIKREHAYAAAVEYEKAHDFASARKFLLRALEAQGPVNDALLRTAARRLRLYHVPLLCPLVVGVERAIARIRWYCMNAVVQARSHLRFERHDVLGFIVASPNPAPSSANSPGVTWVELEWASAATEVVEVRLGKPNGQLICNSGPWGKTQTGDWVADGTVFYLQNVLGRDGTLPLTLENTLDVVRVRVEQSRD